MKALDVIAYSGFGIAVIALPFLVYNWLVYMIRGARAERNLGPRVRKPICSILFFAIPVLLGLVAGETSKRIGHDHVRRALESFRSDYQLRVNGKPVPNSNEILAILKTLHWTLPHHSSPTNRLDIEVSDQHRRVLLWVSRDSNHPQEYWVFYPKYLLTAHNEVGRIITPIFDGY